MRRAELSVAGQASPGPKRAPTLPHTLLAPQGWVLLGLSDVVRARAECDELTSCAFPFPGNAD